MAPETRAKSESEDRIDLNDLPVLCLDTILHKIEDKQDRRALARASSAVYRLVATPAGAGCLPPITINYTKLFLQQKKDPKALFQFLSKRGLAFSKIALSHPPPLSSPDAVPFFGEFLPSLAEALASTTPGPQGNDVQRIPFHLDLSSIEWEDVPDPEKARAQDAKDAADRAKQLLSALHSGFAALGAKVIRPCMFEVEMSLELPSYTPRWDPRGTKIAILRALGQVEGAFFVPDFKYAVLAFLNKATAIHANDFEISSGWDGRNPQDRDAGAEAIKLPLLRELDLTFSDWYVDEHNPYFRGPYAEMERLGNILYDVAQGSPDLARLRILLHTRPPHIFDQSGEQVPLERPEDMCYDLSPLKLERFPSLRALDVRIVLQDRLMHPVAWPLLDHLSLKGDLSQLERLEKVALSLEFRSSVQMAGRTLKKKLDLKKVRKIALDFMPLDPVGRVLLPRSFEGVAPAIHATRELGPTKRKLACPCEMCEAERRAGLAHYWGQKARFVAIRSSTGTSPSSPPTWSEPVRQVRQVRAETQAEPGSRRLGRLRLSTE